MPFDRLFSEFKSSSTAQGALGGAASGAMVALLMNKKARKNLGGTALKLGGAAAVAGVGYYAYQQWPKRKSPGVGEMTSTSASVSAPVSLPALARASVAPVNEPPALPVVDDSLAFKMIKTMIAAAQADGQIDDAELAKLEEAVHSAGLSPAEDAAVMAALNTPVTMEEIAQWPASPAEAAELYGAALLAVDPDTVSEKFFLRRLASTLRLPVRLTAQLNASVTRA